MSRGANLSIGPARLDDDGNMHVIIGGHDFIPGDKYTILEMGWAAYVAQDEVPDDWLGLHGETRPAEEGCNELASGSGCLVTSHPVLVALSIRAWWHMNSRPIPTSPEVVIPNFAEAVQEVRDRQILNDFNEKYKGKVPGLRRCKSEAREVQPQSPFWRSE